MNIVFTICSNNYLAQAVTLGQSLVKFNPDYKFVIGLVDKRISEIDYKAIPFDILEVESIGIDGFDEMIKRYDITELNTAVKPFYFKHFFSNTIDGDTVIYLDPDILVYSSFIDLEKALIENDIVITPHFTTPLSDDKKQQEEDFLNSGIYNLGFIAVKNTDVGNSMINWWAERLLYRCYIDFEKGLFTDQIWINFVPLYFSGVHILLHKGYNIAYWNLHERQLSLNGNSYFVNEIEPLAFYHFSGFNPQKSEVLAKYQDRYTFQNKLDIVPLFEDYSSKLLLNQYGVFINYKCFYNGIKEELDASIKKSKIDKIPIYKKVIRNILLRIIKRFDILMSYDNI